MKVLLKNLSYRHILLIILINNGELLFSFYDIEKFTDKLNKSWKRSIKVSKVIHLRSYKLAKLYGRVIPHS